MTRPTPHDKVGSDDLWWGEYRRGCPFPIGWLRALKKSPKKTTCLFKIDGIPYRPKAIYFYNFLHIFTIGLLLFEIDEIPSPNFWPKFLRKIMETGGWKWHFPDDFANRLLNHKAFVPTLVEGKTFKTTGFSHRSQPKPDRDDTLWFVSSRGVIMFIPLRTRFPCIGVQAKTGLQDVGSIMFPE